MKLREGNGGQELAVGCVGNGVRVEQLDTQLRQFPRPVRVRNKEDCVCVKRQYTVQLQRRVP